MTVRFFEDGLARCARGPLPGGQRLPTEGDADGGHRAPLHWEIPSHGVRRLPWENGAGRQVHVSAEPPCGLAEEVFLGGGEEGEGGDDPADAGGPFGAEAGVLLAFPVEGDEDEEDEGEADDEAE